MTKVFFSETQRFTQWWLWVLLLGILFFLSYGLFQQIVLGEPFGNNPAPDWLLFMVVLFIAGMNLLFWRIRLETTIDEASIRFHFSPFANREFRWSDIQQAEVVDYGFVGGWGLRFSGRYGSVYNTAGNTGLFLQLKNGDKFCIGTQKEIELRQAIESLLA